MFESSQYYNWRNKFFIHILGAAPLPGDCCTAANPPANAWNYTATTTPRWLRVMYKVGERNASRNAQMLPKRINAENFGNTTKK